MARALEEMIARNVASIEQLRRRAAARRAPAQRFADAAFRIVGSGRFVVAHIVVLVVWILLNAGVIPGIAPWDPWPFVALTTFVPIEAIVLSLLVLASQNRAGRLADQRSDLDLQVNLIAEYEITRILARVSAIADHLEVEVPAEDPAEAEELQEDLAPSNILRALAAEADESDHLIDPDADRKPA